MVQNGEIQLMLITSSADAMDQRDGRALRRLALGRKIPIITTISGANATLQAVAGLIESPVEMKALQDYFIVDKASAPTMAAAVN